nr:peptidase M24 [Microbacterium amylolyticum]
MIIDSHLPASSDRGEKIFRLSTVLARHNAEAVRLTSAASLAWLLDGARTAIPTGGPPVFSARVDRDGTVVVRAPKNEAFRLAEEELSACRIDVVDWHAPFDEVAGDEIAESRIDIELRAARAQLLPVERDRYRTLGQDAATAMTQALLTARPAHSEHALAAAVASAMYERAIEPAVVLVAGESRSGVQHPLPTAAPLGRRAMAVATARRHGLHLSLSRWVGVGGTAPDAAIYEVEADAWEASRPGRRLGDVLTDIGISYARNGMDPDGASGWRLHHQGGPTGYAGRDPKATPSSADIVVNGGAFAWNPWVPGAKVEDTVVIDGGHVDILSTDPAWPTIAVRGRHRPAMLDLS